MWQMENRFESTVMEALNNSFGPLDDSGGFLPLLIAAASNAVEDNLPDYLLDLEDMKGVPSPDTFKALLANSVIYMVMHRCGMEPDTLLFERDFQGIDEFASTDSFMILGCASSSISEMLLREIGDTVRNMEITEKKRNRTFAMPSNNRYNDSNKTYPTAITQNVEYLLDSVQASTMLSSSEFIVMLNQAAPDREKLARLLSISPEQMSYITDVEPGCGLIKYGSTLVPFVNKFPKDTKLYELMTTKPGEGVFAGASNDDKQ